jgi:hypothetical protein
MQKEKLNKAFKALRKLGYVAKQNFLCCQNCAWSALTDEQAEKAVFYHAQDFSDLKRSRSCCLAWSGDANEIIKVLNDNGVHTEWNGSENTRIKIVV